MGEPGGPPTGLPGAADPADAPDRLAAPDLADPADLAGVAARFGELLRAAGLPVGPDRTARFAAAVALVAPRTTRELYWCALATLVSDPAHVDVLDRVFAAVFDGDPADERGDQHAPRLPSSSHAPPTAPRVGVPHLTSSPRVPWPAGAGYADRAPARRPDASVDRPVRSTASGAERLGGRDFAELSPDELLLLADLMRRRALATPSRRSRRYRPAARGHRVDLRATLRAARCSAGDPVRVSRRTPRTRPRRLVVLCDISGSMEPYARAMLQLLCCAAGGARAEVFTFATRLTRLTRVLARSGPALALQRAGQAAPDWSGGTRIGAALKEFNDTYGCRGMARGAVVLVISDGWETGDPALLGREMARLSRVAHRVVWANPRTQDPRYRPLVGGMAAAWPYCDAVVSAHRLDALDDLTAALADPVRDRRVPN